MRRLLLLTAIALVSLPLLAQAAKNADDDFLDRFNAVKQFEETAISPDGKRVAWVVADDGAYADGARVTSGKHDESGLAFSPDSKHLAYISDKQLLVAGREATNVKGWLAEPKWSPDGKSIAFLLIENASRASGPLVAMSRGVGVIDEDVAEQRIAILDLDTKKLRLVTPADMYVYHFDWSPDGRKLAAVAAPGNGDQNYWIAQLHLVDVSKATMKAIYKPKLQIADPKWTSDGHHIALVEGLMSDEGSTGGDIMMIADDGSSAENYTPKMNASATSIIEADEQGMTFTATINGESSVMRQTLIRGWMWMNLLDKLWHGAQSLGSYSTSRDGKTSAGLTTPPTQPPPVGSGPIGEWKHSTT